MIVTLIDDIVYEKYGYEREEIERHLEELPLLARDLRRCRQNLFAEIGQFNMDSMESPNESEDEGREKLATSVRTQSVESSHEKV